MEKQSLSVFTFAVMVKEVVRDVPLRGFLI